MNKGLEMIQQSEYVTYIYENKEEERKHRKEMMNNGWHINGFLTDLKEGEKVYWKHKDIKYENYVDRSDENKGVTNMTGTFVISAFPACGKSYCFKNHQDKFTMLDSDSSEFSWVKDIDGNNTKERNKDFPNNYIEHIKSNIGKVDIIFVSSHEVVRKALVNNNINTIIVYPNKELKNEWIRRFRKRGNNEGFINFISNNWDNFIDDIENDDNGFLKEKLNDENSYLDLNFLLGTYDNSMGNLSCMWIND